MPPENLNNNRMNATVNVSGRAFELDFAKALAIVFMVLVHCFETSPIGHSEAYPIFGTVVEFLGSQPAAAVFMFCMGVGMVYTRHSAPALLARRGVKLLIIGYGLNLYRAIVEVLGYFIGTSDAGELLGDFITSLLIVDILQFAGLAFLFFALIKRLDLSDKATGVVVLGLLVLAPYLPRFGEGWYSYLIGDFWYQNEETAFPLFQWLPFPMAGIYFGKYLKEATDKQRFYGYTAAVGAVLFALSTAIALYTDRSVQDFFDENYYNMNLLQVLWSLGVILLLLALYYFAVGTMRDNALTETATFCSKNINQIYLWQWVLITPLALLTAVYLPVDTPLLLLVETALVLFICVLIARKTSWLRI